MLPAPEKIAALARKLHPTQVKWRRHFHRYPELSNKEFETTAFIRKILKQHRIDLIPVALETGAASLIRGSGTRTAALRTDIDALAVTERNDIPYRSKYNGVMHACGHDIHMAVVLGATVLLKKIQKDLPGNVTTIYQPSEEEPPGGARRMIESGVLENPAVGMVFGLHTDPTIAPGKISLRDGPTMAAVMDFDLTIRGLGGHAAAPHKTVDAVAVAAEVVESLQKVVSRETNPMEPAVITFGTISGGTMRNVIAEQVVLKGTARTLSDKTRRQLPRLIKRTLSGICRARGAGFDLEIKAGYPVLENHPAANLILRESYLELFGGGNVKETKAVMGGEDFSFYLREKPGAMFRLGIRNPEIGATRPWHASDFMADEESIFYGTALLVKAVLRYLDRGK